MTASIEPISDKIAWSAKAAATDAAERVEHESPFVAIWITKDDKVKWSKTNCSARELAVFATLFAELSQACWREGMK